MIKNKVIYIDPPWSYDGNVMKTKTGDSTVSKQYKTMTDQELLSFPINDFADNDCYIFMWTTSPKLDFGIELLKHWGFEYKTCLVWKKEYNKRGGYGQGTYFQIITEFLLFGKRGNLKQFHSGKPNFLNAEWRGHSKKPQQFRTLIENCTHGLKPRIEIFAREKPHDWDVFGNDPKLQNISLESFQLIPTKITEGNSNV